MLNTIYIGTNGRPQVFTIVVMLIALVVFSSFVSNLTRSKLVYSYVPIFWPLEGYWA